MKNGGGNNNSSSEVSGVRYIRDWLNGSNVNEYNHWVEIQAIDASGNNVAQGKNITSKNAVDSRRPLSITLDGKYANSNYSDTGK